MFSSVDVVTTPAAGAGGFGVGLGVFAFYPMPAIQVTPMEADPDVFSTSTIFRLQAQPFTARVGGETLPLSTAMAGREPPEGDLTLTAFDAGDGGELSGSAGRLAVVTLPLTHSERAAVTQRAADAGTALLAFVAPDRTYATPNAVFPARWADIPTVIATGPAAARLQAAAAAAEPVTVSATASPFVYDIVTPSAHAVDPAPVITRQDQHDLAILHEHFHRDPDGAGGTGDRRYPISVSLMNLDSVGPLPARRTAYATAGVTWESIVFGPGFFGIGGEEPIFAESIALSMDEGRVYPAGSPTTLSWLSRPLYPGPVGTPLGSSFCQPTPVLRTSGTLQLWLAPFQDGPDRFDTSTDGGTTWRPATVQPQGDGRYRVTLPRAAAGTPISLRVDATDQDGNRIEQTLFDAFTA